MYLNFETLTKERKNDQLAFRCTKQLKEKIELLAKEKGTKSSVLLTYIVEKAIQEIERNK